jgi:hypothetical protein
MFWGVVLYTLHMSNKTILFAWDCSCALNQCAENELSIWENLPAVYLKVVGSLFPDTWYRGLSLSPVYNGCHHISARLFRIVVLFICVFVYSPMNDFSAVWQLITIDGRIAANLDLCLTLPAFSSEGSFTCHTYCDTGPLLLRSFPKDPWSSPLNVELLAKEQLLPISTC